MIFSMQFSDDNLRAWSHLDIKLLFGDKTNA